MHRRAFVQLTLGALTAAASPHRLKGAPPAALRELAAHRNLLFGSAVSDSNLKHPDISALLVQQCSILVPENQMKWTATQPEQARFDFTQADAFMNFVESNHRLARGHNLCWHEHNPAWLDAAATPQNAADLLRTHIQTVAGRYKSRIHSWDVVNEAIRPEHHNPHDLTNSVWLKNIGEDYIDIAYRTAHEADPSALLTYNDFDIETDASEQEKKREAILALLHRMKKKGTPIHAMGVQSHLRTIAGTPTWNGLNKFLKEISKMKLQVYVTELDVDDSGLPGDIPGRDRLVADLYRSYLENILRHKSLKAVLTWCLSDRDSWLQHFRPRKDGLPQRSLPFDADLNPKPAFFAIRDAFSAKS